MGDEKGREAHWRTEPTGDGPARGKGVLNNGVNSNAASQPPSTYAMQSTGAVGSGNTEGDCFPWETINRLAKQKRHEEVLIECNKALQISPDDEKVLERKVRALCQLGRFHGAFNFATQWLEKSPDHPVAKKELKRLKTVLAALEDQDDSEDEEIVDVTSGSASSLARKVENVVPPKPVPRNTVRVLPPQPSPSLKQKRNNVQEDQKHFCPFCDLHFDRQEELDAHCHSDLHKKQLASDESHQWNYRPPPRGQTSDDYALCQRFLHTQRCSLGDKCTFAHSPAELDEWRARFDFRKQQLQQARDKQLHGNTFIEQLLEKLTHPDGPQARLVQTLDFVKIHVNSDLKVNMTTKKCTNAWTFTVTSKICLHAVGLLDDANGPYFHISSISVGPKKTQKYQNLENHCQEWTNQDTTSKGQGEYVYRVKIVFKTDIYGTFRQQVVLGFGLDTVLVRDVQVESCPATDPDKLTKDLELSGEGRWTPESVEVVPFVPPLFDAIGGSRFSKRTSTEDQLLTKYVLPRLDRLSDTLMQPLSKENYRLWMHEMLYLEEMSELGYVHSSKVPENTMVVKQQATGGPMTQIKICWFNVTGSLQLVNRFLLMPGALSSAKYTREGELFARLKLEDVLSEDSSAGRLILQNAQTAWVAPANTANQQEGSAKAKTKVYEAQIEDKGKTFVFLRLSADCVSELSLTCDEDFPAQIQFQLNRLPKCEMHAAVDDLSTLNIVFPDVNNIPPHPPPAEPKTLVGMEGMRLNSQQKEAILTITSPERTKQPPLLIIGPFGTGKTYTLAQAAKLVLQQEGTRILICTHSNSAADLYIKDFLHPYVEEGHEEARPLRLYYRLRWVNTIPEVILPYTLWSSEKQMFCVPTAEDVMKHRVIITTLSTARYVSDTCLPPGFFTHIFIDEAAQALECETLIPLGMADEKTRIVLAGDHLQISPEVYSEYTRQQGFHISFLERLYDLYPSDSAGMVMLCENYRSHLAIVDFTSELFYDHRLVASGKQSPHPTFFPLSFCHAKGIEEQHDNSTGFYNLSEVYEIVDRVDELRRCWPAEWGDIENNGVSVVAPYHDQVIRIRTELRKKKIHNISVERVLNVQGKQYRVIIISTVRTRNTCRSDSTPDYLDYGFLSNVKLLNTAITRAQSLVMVVGDPLSLCLVGKCRKVWEYFLETCHQNNSLFGITWAELRASLDRAEVAKTFILNPLAPEFVPNRRFHLTLQGSQEAPASMVPLQSSTWPYYINQHHPIVQTSPYQMVHHPQFMPYYGMPVFPQFLAPYLMRPQSGASVRIGGSPHRVGAQPRPSMHHHQAAAAVAARAEGGGGVRVVEMSHSLRSPGRFQARAPRVPVYPMPRLPPLPYPPYHHLQLHPPMYTSHPAHPGYYVMPEDPRLAPLHGGLPYAPQPHPHFSSQQQVRGPIAGPHNHLHSPHFHQGAPLHHHVSSYVPASPPQPGSSPQGGRGTPAEDRDSLPSPEHQGRRNTNGNGGVSVPGSGQGFQVLPNVKHVPAHLMRSGLQPASNSQGSSRSSTPINPLESGAGGGTPSANPISAALSSHRGERRGTPVSERPYSPANYAMAQGAPIAEPHRDRSGSRERDLTGAAVKFSPAHLDSDSGGAGVGLGGVNSGGGNGSAGGDGVSGRERDLGSAAISSVGLAKKASNPKQLRLRTGFSRQFSDDLPTPTAITDIVRMIEENIEEGPEHSDSSPTSSSPASSTPPQQRMQLLSRLNGRNAALSSLNLDLVAAQQRQQMSLAFASTHSTPSCSDSPAALNGERPTYAGIVGKPQGQGQGQGLMVDISQLEPQTPRTPTGFTTPGADTQIDPYGILKSLNIEASSAEHHRMARDAGAFP